MTWNSAREEKENWRKTFACQPFNEGNRSKSGQMHPHQCSRQNSPPHTQSSFNDIGFYIISCIFYHFYIRLLSLSLFYGSSSEMNDMMLSRRIWESSHLPREKGRKKKSLFSTSCHIVQLVILLLVKLKLFPISFKTSFIGVKLIVWRLKLTLWLLKLILWLLKLILWLLKLVL